MSEERAERPYKRREMLVDTNLQVGLPLKIIGALYAYALIFAVLANAPAIWDFLTAEADTAEYVWAMDQLIGLVKFLVVPVVLTFVLAMHGLALAHRFAGPIFRFKKVLQTLAKEERPERIYLRDKDQLKDLADEVNVAIEALNKQNADLRRMNFEAMNQSSVLVDLIRDRETDRVDLALAAQNVLETTARVDRRLGGPGALQPTPTDEADEVEADSEGEADDEVAGEKEADDDDAVEDSELELEAV